MARPKSGRPVKKDMCLTVSQQTRTELAFVSAHYGKSISALVSEWAAKEAKAICERTGEEFPNANQITIEDIQGE